jgi:hypothetical protein
MPVPRFSYYTRLNRGSVRDSDEPLDVAVATKPERRAPDLITPSMHDERTAPFSDHGAPPDSNRSREEANEGRGVRDFLVISRRWIYERHNRSAEPVPRVRRNLNDVVARETAPCPPRAAP